MLFFPYTYQHTSININGSVIESRNCEKLLRITIDSDFTCKKTNLIRHVEKLAKNCMLYLQFHIICPNKKADFIQNF